jgi:PKD repeat protein
VNFTVIEVNRNDASHELMGTVTNVKNKSEITLTVDGKVDNGFQFVPNTTELSTKFKLSAGTHTITVTAKNECGEDSKSFTVTVAEPCVPPVVNFTVTEVNRNDASHELMGTVTNVKNKSDITLTVDGKADNGFQFVPNTTELSTKFKLSAGTHTITVTAKNECGEDSKSFTVTVKEPEVEEEKACGPRINPGNSEWQFCLVTPSGIYNRENLASNGFTYSGPASSLFIMPIAGGGDAIVNGQPYAIKSGQYYLFNGNMTVTVSTSNPGSMGHWSVCIDTDKAPTFGNGNSRPKSPCEAENNNGNGGSGGSNGGNSGGQGGGSGSGNKGGQGGGSQGDGNTGGRSGMEGEEGNNAQRSQQNSTTTTEQEKARKQQEDAQKKIEEQKRAAEEQKRKAEEQKKAAEEAKRKARCC